MAMHLCRLKLKISLYNIIDIMKSHQLLSDKDLQVLKITYRTVIENFYENPSDENASNIVLLNSLATQTISTREQSDSLLLISIL